MKRFKELLGLIQAACLAGQIGAREQIQPPEGKAFAQGLMSHDNTLNNLALRLLLVLHRFVLALCDELCHIRRHVEKFEQRLERGQAPFFKLLQVVCS